VDLVRLIRNASSGARYSGMIVRIPAHVLVAFGEAIAESVPASARGYLEALRRADEYADDITLRWADLDLTQLIASLSLAIDQREEPEPFGA
jgi:hypothetical protein